MKSLAKFLSVGAVILASAPLALAMPITGSVAIGGGDTFTPTSISFTNPGTVLLGTFDLSSFVGRQATLAGFAFNSSANGTTLFTTTNAMGSILSFVITGITSSGPDPLILAPNTAATGTGTFYDTAAGFTATPGTFSLTTSTTGVTSFQLNSKASPVSPVPEPSSLILLGTGLMGAAGTVLRKRRMA